MKTALGHIHDITQDVLDVHEDRISTHYEGCWKYHIACLASYLHEMSKEEV